MACNNQSELIGNMVTRARRDLFMITADTFEAREFIFANVRSLLIKLEGIRIIYPLRDWDRLQLAINRVLVEGWPFADPVAVALLLISLKRQDLWLSDSLG
jgi:hypothetical protein